MHVMSPSLNGHDLLLFYHYKLHKSPVHALPIFFMPLSLKLKVGERNVLQVAWLLSGGWTVAEECLSEKEVKRWPHD